MRFEFAHWPYLIYAQAISIFLLRHYHYCSSITNQFQYVFSILITIVATTGTTTTTTDTEIIKPILYVITSTIYNANKLVCTLHLVSINVFLREYMSRYISFYVINKIACSK